MRGSVAIVVAVALAGLQSGCGGSLDAAVVEARRQQLRRQLPPPPSEELRRELRAVKVSAGGLPTAVALSAPAKGAGAARTRYDLSLDGTGALRALRRAAVTQWGRLTMWGMHDGREAVIPSAGYYQFRTPR
jgi:hypothetical protein